jgi:hypothetical protein
MFSAMTRTIRWWCVTRFDRCSGWSKFIGGYCMSCMHLTHWWCTIRAPTYPCFLCCGLRPERKYSSRSWRSIENIHIVVKVHQLGCSSLSITHLLCRLWVTTGCSSAGPLQNLVGSYCSSHACTDDPEVVKELEAEGLRAITLDAFGNHLSLEMQVWGVTFWTRFIEVDLLSRPVVSDGCGEPCAASSRATLNLRSFGSVVLPICILLFRQLLSTLGNLHNPSGRKHRFTAHCYCPWKNPWQCVTNRHTPSSKQYAYMQNRVLSRLLLGGLQSSLSLESAFVIMVNPGRGSCITRLSMCVGLFLELLLKRKHQERRRVKTTKAYWLPSHRNATTTRIWKYLQGFEAGFVDRESRCLMVDYALFTPVSWWFSYR